MHIPRPDIRTIRPKRQGLTLVAVLWLVMLLTVLITTLAKSVRLENRLNVSSQETTRLSWACRAGLETALALLNDDERAGDGLCELWSDNDADCRNVALNRCRFDLEIIDEAGKLNINTATREQLLELPGMTPSIADAILDWRDQDDQAQTQGVEGGYYANLRPGYEIRNGHLLTIRELALVKNVTPELLYGEDLNQNRLLDDNERDGNQRPPDDDGDKKIDPGWIEFLTCYSYDVNLDALGRNRTNINSADQAALQYQLGVSAGQAKWILEKRPFQGIADLIEEDSPREPPQDDESNEPRRLDLATFRRIADQITVKDEELTLGLVNINTAPLEVLAALLEGDHKTAHTIVQFRESGRKTMESIAELLDAKQISITTFKKIAGQITTRSNVFTVYVLSKSDQTGAKRLLEAVVDRRRVPPAALYWYERTN